jgi:hypothetical protein
MSEGDNSEAFGRGEAYIIFLLSLQHYINNLYQHIWQKRMKL